MRFLIRFNLNNKKKRKLHIKNDFNLEKKMFKSLKIFINLSLFQLENLKSIKLLKIVIFLCYSFI